MTSRRVRVTQVDENGKVLMEHSFPIADGVARIDYVVDDEFVPNMLETHVALTRNIVLHS